MYLLYHAHKKAYILTRRMYASFLICQFKVYKIFFFNLRHERSTATSNAPAGATQSGFCGRLLFAQPFTLLCLFV